MSNKLFIKHFKKLTKILNENDEIITHRLERDYDLVNDKDRLKETLYN